MYASVKGTLLPSANPSDTVVSVQEISPGYWSVVTEMETRCSCVSHRTIVGGLLVDVLVDGLVDDLV